MSILNNTKEETEDIVFDAINSAGVKGISLSEICDKVFDKKDSEEHTQINKSHVFNSLDKLLKEGYVSFDLEQDVWTAVE